MYGQKKQGKGANGFVEVATIVKHCLYRQTWSGVNLGRMCRHINRM